MNLIRIQEIENLIKYVRPSFSQMNNYREGFRMLLQNSLTPIISYGLKPASYQELT